MLCHRLKPNQWLYKEVKVGVHRQHTSGPQFCGIMVKKGNVRYNFLTTLWFIVLICATHKSTMTTVVYHVYAQWRSYGANGAVAPPERQRSLLQFAQIR
jgi:hypothetical protein